MTDARITDTDHQLSPANYTLLLAWTPTVETYQDRLAPLARLEARKLLRSFFVREDMAAGRLDGLQIQLRPDGLLLMTDSRLSDELCVDLVRDVIATLRPKSFRSMEIMLQYLVPLTGGTYDEIRIAGLDALKGVNLPSIGANDFAYMISGSASEIDWLIQAGIIATDEIEPRVLRQVGAFRHMPSSDLFLRGDGPEVAFFCDSEWTVESFTPDGDFGDHVLEVAAKIELAAQRVMPEVFRGIVREQVTSNGGNRS